MSSFKFLSFEQLEKNFNQLAAAELEKHGALSDFSKIEESNKERADQLTIINDTIDFLKQVPAISDEEKAKIVTGLELKIKNDIYKTYKYTPEFLIRSVMYKGINPAIGVTADNKLEEGDVKEAIKAYDQYAKALETEQRFAEFRKSEAYKRNQEFIKSQIVHPAADNIEQGVLSEELLYPKTLKDINVDSSIVKDGIHFYADNIGFEGHFKDDEEALGRHKTYEKFQPSLNKAVEEFNKDQLKPLKPLSEKEQIKGMQVYFKANVLSQIGTFKLPPKAEKPVVEDALVHDNTIKAKA